MRNKIDEVFAFQMMALVTILLHVDAFSFHR